MTLRAESTAKSLRSSSPTWRADSDCGSTRSSGKPHLMPRNGAPSTSSSATIATPIGTARRITNFVDRYQKFCSIGLRTGSGLRKIQRASRRTSSESNRSPSSAIAAGATTIAATAANTTTAMPGVGERLQEVHREKHHRDHRQRDRHRREQHGPPRGRHGADQRAVAVGAVGEFVAVPADDQQRVVDGQRQAHRDGQVQREDRHVGDQRDSPQHRHRTRGSRSRRRPTAAPRRSGRRTPRPVRQS